MNLYFCLSRHYCFRMFFAIAIITICACARTDAGSLLENASYMIVKQIMIADGYSETRADCFVKVMKLTGVTADADFANINNHHELMQTVFQKAETADLVCSPIGIIVLVLLLAFVFAIVCVCCKRCCHTQHKPIIIPIPSSQFNLPYTRMDMDS